MTKATKWHVRPAKTQIGLGFRRVCSDVSLSAWRKLGSLATHWAHSVGSDQTGRKPKLIWVFAGCTIIMLVLSWGGSHHSFDLLASQNIFLCLCTPSLATRPRCPFHYNLSQSRTIWAALWQNQQNDCASSEGSDQPGHPPSLIRAFAMRSMGS